MMEEDGVMKSQRRVMKAGHDDVWRPGSASAQVVFGPGSCPSLVGLGGGSAPGPAGAEGRGVFLVPRPRFLMWR